MADTILCPNCGITLRTFMKQCPQCDRVLPPVPPPYPTSKPRARAAQPENKQTEVISLEAIRRRAQDQALPQNQFPPPRHETAVTTPANVIYLAPPDEERRFPLLTRQQLTLLLVGLGLVLFATLIAWLLWTRERRDTAALNAALLNNAPPAPAATSEPESSPTPEAPPAPDDQAITESVKAALTAYNPVGFPGYRFEVKDGIVTLYGVAEHQPEKDGAGNVVRLLSGVKGVINNMAVKPDLNELLGQAKAPLPETKLPDVALAPTRRPTPAIAVRPAAPLTAEAPPPPPTAPPATPTAAQREAERQRQEQEAARQRAAEAEQRQREAAAAEQRQEAARRLEAERRARAEQAILAPNSLRSGTVAWSGIVDGIDEIVITGGSASLRHVSGNPPREVKSSFSASLPRAPVSVQLTAQSGRSTLAIVQQPSAANGFTTIVRVDDSIHNGGKQVNFTLRWTAQ